MGKCQTQLNTRWLPRRVSRDRHQLGLGGDDIVQAGKGNDAIAGNLGDDHLQDENGDLPLAGDDTLDGGLGTDTCTSGETVQNSEGTFLPLFGTGDRVQCITKSTKGRDRTISLVHDRLDEAVALAR